MSTVAYIDTSALAKLYINEPGSESFEAYIKALGSGLISRIAVVEFRSVLARRLRSRELTPSSHHAVRALFEADISRGLWSLVPLDDAHAIDAARLIDELGPHSLRALDALHLATARNMRASKLATADRALGDAGRLLGLSVDFF